VTDAAILAAQAEGVIIVVKSGQTRNDFAQNARDQLRTANARILGTVINEIKNGAGAYNYYHYYAEEEETSKKGLFGRRG
jgi:Mrp family chromosome partitioning ATPase